MLSCTRLIGLPIIALNNGDKIGTVKNLILDPKTLQTAAIVLTEHRNYSNNKIIPYQYVKGVGSYAITVHHESNVVTIKETPELLSLQQYTSNYFKSKQVVSADGLLLGTVEELYLEQETGKLTAMTLSGRLLKNVLHGKFVLPIEQVKTIGNATIITKSNAEVHLTAAPTKVHETLNKVKSNCSQLWQSSKKWTNSLGKTIQDMTADEPPSKKDSD